MKNTQRLTSPAEASIMVRLLFLTRRAFSLCFAAALMLLPSAQAQEPASFSVEDELPQFQEADDVNWSVPWAQSEIIEPSTFRLDLSLGSRRSAGWSADDSLTRAPLQQRFGDELYALATLQVPLERLGRSNSLGLPPFESESTGSDVLVASQEHGGEREKEQPDAEPVVAEPVVAEPAADAGELRPATAPLLLAMAREITARVTAGAQGSDARLQSLARRSRWSGLSPELRLRGVLGFDRTTSTEESSGIYPGDTTTRGARDSLVEARLTFRLDRLVFGNGEDSIERQRIQLAEQKQKRITQALELFTDWRIASLLAADTSLPPDDRLGAQVKADAAMMQLHVLTEGWFEGQGTIDAVRADLADTAQDD